MKKWLDDDRILISDAIAFDTAWLNRLLRAAWLEGGTGLELRIGPIGYLRQHLQWDTYDQLATALTHSSRPHRAEADAALLAELTAEAIRATSGECRRRGPGTT